MCKKVSPLLFTNYDSLSRDVQKASIVEGKGVWETGASPPIVPVQRQDQPFATGATVSLHHPPWSPYYTIGTDTYTGCLQINIDKLRANKKWRPWCGHCFVSLLLECKQRLKVLTLKMDCVLPYFGLKAIQRLLFHNGDERRNDSEIILILYGLNLNTNF